MASLFTASKFSATDASGNPLDGGKVWTYAAGTLTPKATYTTQVGDVPNSNPVILDGSGRAHIWLGAGAYKFVVTDANDVAAPDGTVDNITGEGSTVLADLASTASSSVGTGLLGWLRGLTGAVATTLYRWMHWQDPCIFEWMTTAQIADYQARTAVANMAGALDLTTPIQAAIDASYAAGQKLYFPPGAARVTGLEVPTNSALYEDRGDAWCMYGAGAPQPFVREPRSGTLLISNTDVPVLRYHQRRAMPTAGGNTQVKAIRFEQRNVLSTSAVVLWDSMSEDAEFSNNGIVQFGLGDGFKTTYQIKGNVTRNFALCGTYFTAGVSAAGIGFNFPSAGDGGLLTVKKNTARCWNWGYVHGDGTNDSSGALFEQNECSDCTNGLWNRAGCSAATISKTYTEGITGTCVKDEGAMTTIKEGHHYLGFAVGIDASEPSNYGTSITNNNLECAAASTLIKVGSGGPFKSVRGNHLLFSESGGVVTNVIGIEITGPDPRLDIASNAFLPRGAWTGGAGTVKILNSSTGGIVGALPLADGADAEIPSMLRCAVSLQENASTLTQANVAANVLTLPTTNVVNINATGAATVNSLAQSADFTGGARVVHLVVSNNNMTFADTASLVMAGGASFTGSASGGMLSLLIRVETGTVRGYEIARVSF